MATIGDRIHYSRIKKSMTLDDLADAIGTTKQNISRYEKNIITNIPMNRLESIAAALDVSPVWLMGWAESSSTQRLSQAEEQLISLYRGLNNQGRQLLLMNAETFAGNPALRKDISEPAI